MLKPRFLDTISKFVLKLILVSSYKGFFFLHFDKNYILAMWFQTGF